MREIAGTASLNNSSRFPLSSLVSLVRPVMLPPGRAKLSTSFSVTGSYWVTMTMGIVLVAFWLRELPGRLAPQSHRLSVGEILR